MIRRLQAIALTCAAILVAPAAASSPLHAIGGAPTVPKGKPGSLTVVEAGTYTGTTLPIVIRNNTRQAVGSVKVTATAYVGRKLVATGSDQGTKPAVVAKGGLAIGYIYFGNTQLPAGATIHYTATGSTPGGSFSATDLPITTANYTGGKLVGIAHNRTGKKVSGPLGVYATCFSAAGKVEAMETGYADADNAPPGADAPFTLDFTSFGTAAAPTCAHILVAMTGYSF